MSTKLSGFGNAPVAATSAAVRVSILTGVVIFRPCRGPQRSPGALETQCERRSVSEACRRDRAAFRGHESAVLHSIADCNKWRLLWLIAGSAGQIDLNAVVDSSLIRFYQSTSVLELHAEFAGFSRT